jgi:AcrR family transcriptional regulator
MPEPPSPPRRRLLPTRERAASILTAAAAVFARQGYAATTVDQIAAEAGVSKLIVYRHFNSKRELYLAILDQVRDRLAQVPTPQQSVDPADGQAAFRQAVTTLAGAFAVARELPDGFRLLHRHAVHEPEFAGHVADLIDHSRQRIEGMLAPVPDPTLRTWMARLIDRMVDEAFLEWLEVGDPSRDAEMVERVAYLLGGMVGSLWRQPGGSADRTS